MKGDDAYIVVLPDVYSLFMHSWHSSYPW